MFAQLWFDVHSALCRCDKHPTAKPHFIARPPNDDNNNVVSRQEFQPGFLLGGSFPQVLTWGARANRVDDLCPLRRPVQQPGVDWDKHLVSV